MLVSYRVLGARVLLSSTGSAPANTSRPEKFQLRGGYPPMHQFPQTCGEVAQPEVNISKEVWFGFFVVE
jgi:hypothetical protein